MADTHIARERLELISAIDLAVGEAGKKATIVDLARQSNSCLATGGPILQIQTAIGSLVSAATWKLELPPNPGIHRLRCVRSFWPAGVSSILTIDDDTGNLETLDSAWWDGEQEQDLDLLTAPDGWIVIAGTANNSSLIAIVAHHCICPVPFARINKGLLTGEGYIDEYRIAAARPGTTGLLNQMCDAIVASNNRPLTHGCAAWPGGKLCAAGGVLLMAPFPILGRGLPVGISAYGDSEDADQVIHLVVDGTIATSATGLGETGSPAMCRSDPSAALTPGWHMASVWADTAAEKTTRIYSVSVYERSDS
jgi:hypothetical protein